MEITSFVLGMLTIVAAGISASIVVGLAKINQLNKQLDNLSQQHERDLIHIFKVIGEKNNEVWRQFGDTSRDITMVEKTIMNQIESIDREHLRHEEELHREIDETKRYIDSRIDKVVLKGTEPGSKQILKG